MTLGFCRSGRLWIRRCTAFSAGVLMLVALNVSPVFAQGQHFDFGCDSVTNGAMAVYYFGAYPEKKYELAVMSAADAWREANVINVYAKPYTHDGEAADLYVDDYMELDGILAHYACAGAVGAADWVWLNDFHLGEREFPEWQAVLTHELGHALSLGDHYEAQWRDQSVMWYVLEANYFTAPQEHDVDDLRFRWGPWARQGSRHGYAIWYDTCPPPALSDSPCPQSRWGESSDRPYDDDFSAQNPDPTDPLPVVGPGHLPPCVTASTMVRICALTEVNRIKNEGVEG
jgi:hypothetical protein